MGFFSGLKEAYGQFDKNVMGGYLPGGAERSRMAGMKLIDGMIDDAKDQGFISVPTVIPAIEGGAKFVKSYLGDVAKPFKIEKSFIGRDEKFAKEIKNASIDGDKISYGMQSPGYEDASGLKEELERGILGQWDGTIKEDGSVVIKEDENQTYDTNQPKEWHAREAKKQFDSGNFLGGMMSKVWESYADRQEQGLTNLYPQGKQEQIIGKIDFENTISEPQSRPTPPAQEPTDVSKLAKSYEIQQGDTLTAIAKEFGLSIDDIAKKNNISNVNNISVGQQLNF